MNSKTVSGLIRLFVALAVLLIFAEARANSADDQIARDTAQRWLALLDSGKYEQAYAELSQRVRDKETEDHFLGMARSRRMPLGHPRQRSLLQAKRTRQLIGRPNGEYQDVAFKTSFAHKADAVERVVVAKEAGTWRVLIYKIY